jgi:hypothetical protein
LWQKGRIRFVCRATPVGTTKILTGVLHGYTCGFSCGTQKALYFHPFFSSGLSGEVGYDEDRGFGALESWDGLERASAILVTGLAAGGKT